MNVDGPANNLDSLEMEAVGESEIAESSGFEGRLLLGAGGLLVVGVVVLAGLTVLLRRQTGAG